MGKLGNLVGKLGKLREIRTDYERCWQLYQQSKGKVEHVKSLVMPHLKSVTEARLDYEIDCAENRLNAVGTMLDPENQLDEDICELEGVTEHV